MSLDFSGKEEEGEGEEEEEEDDSKFMEAFTGLLRVTVNIKGDLSRAARMVVDPKTDTWEGFVADVFKKLKITSKKFTIERARTRALVNSIPELKPNDVLSVTPIIVKIKEVPLTDSPLSVARVRHMKIQHVGPKDRNGVTFVCKCTKKGLPDPDALVALKLEVDVTHPPKHPFHNEYDVLAKVPPHQHVAPAWGRFKEDELVKKILKRVPAYIHTIWGDQKALDAKWLPRAQFTLLDFHADNLADLRPLFTKPLGWKVMIGWAQELASAQLHLFKSKVVHLSFQPENILVKNNGRLAVTNFTSAKRFKSRSMVLDYEPGDTPGGPKAYLSPEVLSAFWLARSRGRGAVPYRGQGVWELGILIAELLVGEHPWPGYPEAYTVEGEVVYDLASFGPWMPREWPMEFKDLLLNMMHPNPDVRPKLQAVYDTLTTLREAAWGPVYPPETKWGLDDSLTGKWVRTWTYEGVLGLVPRPEAGDVVLRLRDSAAVRVAVGEWWEQFSIRYRGKRWHLLLESVGEMELRDDSVIYVYRHPSPPTPKGPLPVYDWEWSGMDPVRAMRKLAELLEDHTSPVEFTLEGMDYVLTHISLPEVLWEESPQVATPQMIELMTSQLLPSVWKAGGATLCPFVVTQFVASYAKHPVIIAKAAEMLHWLGMNAKVREKTRRTHGAHMLVTSMVAHRFYGDVQKHGAWALANLALDEMNRDFIRELGGVAATLEGLEPHIHAPDVLQFGLLAITILCTENEANKYEVVKLGGIDTAMAAVEHHPGGGEVLTKAFSALYQMCEGVDAHVDEVGDCGVIPHLVSAMEAHRLHGNLHVAAASLALVLSFDHPKNKRELGKAGIIPELLKGCRTHLNDPVVTRYLVNCIKTLAEFDEENWEQANEIDAVEEFVLIRASHTDPMVVKACNRALRLLHGAAALKVSDSD